MSITYTDLHLHTEYSLPIPGTNNKYFATRDGEIFNSAGKTISPFITDKGYKRVSLYINGKPEKHFVHRLVAITFILNTNNLPQVNHKDTDKLNNHDWNLEWSSVSNNIKHGIDNGLYTKQLQNQSKASRISANKHSIEVIQCDFDGNIICTFKNKHDASRATGIMPNNIRACCLGQRKSAGGFTWKYRR